MFNHIFYIIMPSSCYRESSILEVVHMVLIDMFVDDLIDSDLLCRSRHDRKL